MNTFQTKAGAYTCEVCEEGKTAGEGDVLCTSCPLGTYSSPEDRSAGGTDGECWACGEGTAVKNNRCQDCEVGRYSEQPSGYVAEQDYSENGLGSGKTGNYICSYCASGQDTQNQTGLTECINCPQGKYKFEPNAACEWCEAGKRTGLRDGSAATIAAETCVSCSPGTRSGPGLGPVKSGAVNCVACESGRYSNSERSHNCTVCDAGLFSVSTGSVGPTFCEPCSLGKFNNRTEQARCSLCEPGTYQNGFGSTDCTACEAGDYSEDWGNSACSFCNLVRRQKYLALSTPAAARF